mmetsp:Transcript_23176/g.57158  ORF Transcript_23176/g.57158 Transcript_23176/m.57158 type:complete len:228 (-) Transcript_23176:66-749(-)
MRFFREALLLPSISSAGWARSLAVIARRMPSMRFMSRSARSMSAWPGCLPPIMFCGSLSIRPPRPPIFFICAICCRKSFRSKPLPLLSFSAMAWAEARSTLCVTCSTRATMSPMPSTRPAWRSASKTSRPSIFSDTPANLIGAPVIWRTDRAAPPRESPSSLVRITPVSGSASLKALAVLTASWPCIASTTNSVSTGWSTACRSLISAIKASSIASRPAVSTSSTSR